MSARHGALLALLLLPALAGARRPLTFPLPPAPIPEATAEEGEVAPAALLPTAMGEPPAPSATPALLEKPNGSIVDAWVDLPHAFLERRIFGIVDGFDRFFADERDLGSARPTSFVRLRSQLRVQEDGTLAYGASVRADLALPYIRKRLKRFRILLEDAGRGLTDSEPRALSGQGGGGRTDAVLRLTLLQTLRSSLDLGGGVIFALPPGVVGRLRFRHAQALGRVALARIAASGFWDSREGWGSNGSLAFERALGRRLLLRWTSGTLVTQASHGYESASELALLATLGRFTGLTLLGSGSTRSKPELVVQTWRVAARLRTSLFRRWLFGEVEPEVAWPLEPTGRSAVSAVFFRLEVQFEQAAMKK